MTRLYRSARLVVLANFALVVVMALARDDVRAEFMGEAIGRVLLVAGVVGVDAYGAVRS